jgi:hypothetical protein
VIEWAELNAWQGPVPHRSTIADYFRGKAFPSREFVDLFTEALELDESEKNTLAHTFTYPIRRSVADGVGVSDDTRATNKGPASR